MLKTIYAAGMLLSLFCFTGCVKTDKSEQNCTTIQTVKITGAQKQYYKGDEINLSVSAQPEAYFSWRRAGTNELSMYSSLTINYCDKSHEGMYYLTVSYPGCPTHYDSVYISVINKPVEAPCSPANNAISFSSLPSISFSAASWEFNNTWNRKLLRGYQSFGYPDLNVYFHYYWNNREPEDGEYSISESITTSDGDAYQVYITSLYSGIYFQSHPGKVYVKHVNGKIQVTICNLTLSGSNGGLSATTTVEGKLTAQ